MNRDIFVSIVRGRIPLMKPENGLKIINLLIEWDQAIINYRLEKAFNQVFEIEKTGIF